MTEEQEGVGTEATLDQELRQSFSFLFTTVMGVLATQKAMIAAMHKVDGFAEAFGAQIRHHERALEQARVTLLRSLERHMASTPEGASILKQLLAELARKAY
ncbi:MAG: hypothetical protein AAB426_09490 [Myxococcota bacterium]